MKTKPHHESWEEPYQEKLAELVAESMTILLKEIVNGNTDLEVIVNSRDKIMKFVKNLISQTRKEAVREVLERVGESLPKKRIMANPVPDSDLVIGWNSAIEEQRTALDELLKSYHHT